MIGLFLSGFYSFSIAKALFIELPKGWWSVFPGAISARSFLQNATLSSYWVVMVGTELMMGATERGWRRRRGRRGMR